jgi:hypothetical protein
MGVCVCRALAVRGWSGPSTIPEGHPPVEPMPPGMGEIAKPAFINVWPTFDQNHSEAPPTPDTLQWTPGGSRQPQGRDSYREGDSQRHCRARGPSRGFAASRSEGTTQVGVGGFQGARQGASGARQSGVANEALPRPRP